jgi:hypothetical protein
VGPTSLLVISPSSYGIRVASPLTALCSRPLPPHPKVQLRQSTTTADYTFHPRGFSPPRRFPSRASREFIAPHSQPKVHCVSSVIHPHLLPKPLMWRESQIPRNAFHTPRRIPLVCSRTVSPRPLPSCRYRSLTAPKSCSGFPFAFRLVSPHLREEVGSPCWSAPGRLAVALPLPLPVAGKWLQHASTNAAAYKALLR